MQTCSKCGEAKPADSFYAGKKVCKKCVKSAALARYYEKRDDCIARIRAWQEDNPEKHRAYNGKRDAIRRGGKDRIPAGFEIADTFRFYAEAIRKEEETGVPHHVDHIIPVAKGGMHTPSNLQVLTAEENQMKGANA